jgi:maleate isomerase
MSAQDWDIRTAKRLGVVIPSVNIAVEYDWRRIAPDGVTFHFYRIPMPSQSGHVISWDDERQFMAGIKTFMEEPSKEKVFRDMAELCEPDQVVEPVSLETAWDGVRGARERARRLGEWCGGRPAILGIQAIEAALKTLGAKTVAIVAPYPPVAIQRVCRYLSELDIKVAAYASRPVTRAQDIARIPLSELRETIEKINTPEVDAIVQCGAALSTLSLVEEVEQQLSKPMVALNPTVLWHAVRSLGIETRAEGFGTLWRQH